MAPLPAAGKLQIGAEALAARLPPLLVAAQQIAATVAMGVHGRRRTGPGESFWQFRRYQPGDAATAIDWRQSARSDPLYVRETEWTAAQSVWVWPDGSASMRWRSASALPEKRDRGMLLALALAALLLRGGERVGLLGAARAPASGRGVIARLAAEMSALAPVGGLPAALLPRHAHAVLISDFLLPVEDVAAALHRWSAAGVRGYLLQVFDPAEEVLPYEGRTHFFGAEDEGNLLVPRAEALREAYAERLAGHRDALAAAARAAGWGFGIHHTDRPPEPALMLLHQALAQR